MQELRRFLVRNGGAVVVEFALIVIPFIISILFIIEICRVVYIMSSIDLILAETSSATATLSDVTRSDKYFRNIVNKMSRGWGLLLPESNLEVKTNILYCNSIQELTQNECSSSATSPGVSGTAVLGIYEVRVPYKPLFFVFPTSLVEKEMIRRIIFVQEHNLLR